MKILFEDVRWLEMLRILFGGAFYVSCVKSSYTTTILSANSINYLSWLDDGGVRVRFPVGERDVSLFCNDQTGSGATQPPIQLLLGAVSPGIKRPGREADHFHQQPLLRMVELYLHSPIRFQGVVVS
jgi:hypothetical protein